MGQNSNIEWTHHTFNPWRGCTKVSQGCAHCYAETLSGRNPGTLGVWGKQGTRVVASESMWQQPIKWNKAAEKADERHRVFCASLADVFEGPETMPEASVAAVKAARSRLMALIERTPHLDWLLLTKRPGNVLPMLEEIRRDWICDGLPGLRTGNVWLGTSVEDQKTADERIPELLKVPASVHFLSCEPLLGPVDLKSWLDPTFITCMDVCQDELITPSLSYDTWNDSGCESPCCTNCGLPAHYSGYGNSLIDWVICGFESGPKARPGHTDWARELRDQCNVADVAFLFKQWGEWLPDSHRDFRLNGMETDWGLLHHSGTFRSVYQDGERVTGSDPTWREDETGVARVGKKKSGRLLDGRTWDEVPGGES